MGTVGNAAMGAAIAYLERQGFSNVTLVDEGGNVVLSTTGEGTDRVMVAVIVDQYDASDEKWDADGYRECFEDLAVNGMAFGRGDTVTITYGEDGEGGALLEHQAGVWPEEDPA